MSAWNDVVARAPELATRVQERFAAHRHALLATLRADGSPRLSGIETQFCNGHLYMGMMGGSRKALDLRRDGRLSLHSAPDTPEMPAGDARISGVATEVTDEAEIKAWQGGIEEMPPGPFHLFRVDVTEVVHLRPDRDHLVIESWTPAAGQRSVDRY